MNILYISSTNEEAVNYPHINVGASGFIEVITSKPY